MHTLLIIIIILRGDDKSLKRVGPPSHSFSTCGEGGGSYFRRPNSRCGKGQDTHVRNPLVSQGKRNVQR